jgi:NADPH2 dehydrogenase
MISTSAAKSIKVGSFTLSNRIIVPPIARQLATDDGTVTEAVIADYSLHANSGASMVIVEASYVHKTGQIVPNELSIEDDSKIEGLAKLASTIKSYGILTIIQLVHAGRMCCNAGFIAPSAVPFENRTTPRAMNIGDIEHVIDWYRLAVSRAMKAGFDGVEIHCAHGYLLSEFLSPVCNKRTDSYGGSLQNRARLLFQITSNTRKAIGNDKILSVRFGAADCYAGGLKLSESVVVARELERIGVNLLNVSIGCTPSALGGSRTRKPMGFVPIAREIKKNVSIPVSVAGKITTADQIERIISTGAADMVSICRSLLADPKFPSKILGTNLDPITACKSCRVCIHYIQGK